MPCTALLWAILASSVVDSMCFVTGPSMMGTQRRSPQAAPISVEGENPFVSRRGLAWLALSIVALPVAANADGDEPVLKLPEAERIKAPEYACAQGVGGKCDELSEGNPFIKELQLRSAANRVRYQKEELESYWRRNYKDFFDASCTGFDQKCDFKENADGTWSVDAKPPQFKLRESPPQK